MTSTQSLSTSSSNPRIPEPEAPAQALNQGDEPINDPLKQPAFVVEMPGSLERNAEEIQAISPEGMPADPKAGPGELYRYVILAGILLVVLSLALVPFIGWAASVMAMSFSLIAMAINPSVLSTFRRADERRRVLENRDDKPDSPRP
jgi:hypothetical protein